MDSDSLMLSFTVPVTALRYGRPMRCSPLRRYAFLSGTDTDVPCMKLVRSRGGYSVGVYDQSSEKVLKMIRDGRIDYYAPADYSEGGHLDELIKMIIGLIAYRERLSSLTPAQKPRSLR